MTEKITSRKNPVIMGIRALRQKKYRDERGEFVVEGARSVADAFAHGADVRLLLVCDGFAHAEQLQRAADAAGAPVYLASDEAFAAAADTKTPQGVLCVCGRNDVSEETLIFGEPGFYLFCDRVSDPGNLGTILRSAAAFACRGIFLSEGCVDLYSDKTVRATMGTIFQMRTALCADGAATLKRLRGQGVRVLASALGADAGGLEQVGADENVCIVVGNEGSGVREEILRLADGFLKIPMPGGAESLNVSVATGILLYEAARKYGLM